MATWRRAQSSTQGVMTPPVDAAKMSVMAPDLPDRPVPRRSGHLPSRQLATALPSGPRTAGHSPGDRPPEQVRTTRPPPTRPRATQPDASPVHPPPDLPGASPGAPGPSTGGQPGPARPLRVTVCLLAGFVVTAAGVAYLLPGDAPSSPTAGLDADLQARFADAVADAAREGVALTLTSGWRSPADQQRLVDAAVKQHGSLEEARRWVLPPETSAHVAGRAIDVGPASGALWLEERSERYGLCRTYANEGWHFEPVIEPGGTCPAMLDDSSAGWRD